MAQDFSAEQSQFLSAQTVQTSANQQVPMPCNWLSDLREYIKHLRGVSQLQREEYLQILNMFNVSV